MEIVVRLFISNGSKKGVKYREWGFVWLLTDVEPLGLVNDRLGHLEEGSKPGSDGGTSYKFAVLTLFPGGALGHMAPRTGVEACCRSAGRRDGC